MTYPTIRALCVAIHLLRHAIDTRKGQNCQYLRSELATLKQLRHHAISQKGQYSLTLPIS